MSEETLTPRQREVLDAIVNYYQANGVPPSIRELAHLVGINTPNGVNCHLQALEQKGYVINRQQGHSRTWMPKYRSLLCECPHCGEEIEVVEELE